MASVRRMTNDVELSDRERKNFAILDVIRKKGPIARTDVSRLTGFNIVTVSNYIDNYIKLGLVSEEGYDTSTGGRKPMLVNLNAKSAYVIGVGFDMVDMIGLVADLKCNILTEVRRRRPSESGKALVDNLISVVDDLLRKSSVEKDRIKGIGLAVAGVIDNENHTIRWPGPLGTKDLVVSVSLWDEFTKRFNLPVIIENDADCAAFGEQDLALNPEYKNVLYMYSGVSCGIMINGQIYKGTSSCAGELGIMNQNNLDKYDWVAMSRGLGRWNMELGMLDNVKELAKKRPDSLIFKLAKKPEDVTFITLLEAAHKQDALALELIHEGAEALGKKVAFLVNLFNPQIVVIGGGVERAGTVFMDTLKRTVKEWAFE